MTDDEKRAAWKHLCGLAVQLTGSQEKFRKEANVLKRLVRKYGPRDVEYALRGALHLKWTSLLSIGGVESVGWRWALEAGLQSEKRKDWRPPESLRSILAKLGGE